MTAVYTASLDLWSLTDETAAVLTPELDQRLHTLMDAFLEENAKLNLSAFRTADQCWTGNILDSLSFLDIVKRLFPKKPDTLRIADIGTGGGFPLLPLALVMPEWSFVGVDATQKKIAAIERIAQKLGMTNITFACARAEDLGHQAEFRESFDVVTARALASLPTLMEYTSPFCAVEGKCVYWKSLHIADEQRESVNAMKKLNLSVHSTHAYTLADGWGTRQLLVYEKTAPLSADYPRKAGVPHRDPL